LIIVRNAGESGLTAANLKKSLTGRLGVALKCPGPRDFLLWDTTMDTMINTVTTMIMITMTTIADTAEPTVHAEKRGSWVSFSIFKASLWFFQESKFFVFDSGYLSLWTIPKKIGP
jgi:hypothetical protein